MKPYRLILLPILVLTFVVPSMAQEFRTADEAADSAQSRRADARAYWTKKNVSAQDIQYSVQIIQNTLRFLDSVPIVNLGEGSNYLKLRKSDITRDLVYAYAKGHRYPEAIDAMNKLFDLGLSFAVDQMEKDSIFNTLKNDAGFVAVMDKFKKRVAFWGGKTFKTAYQRDLPEAEKIAGLSLLWSQAHNYFVYFDHLPADWNQTYMNFIPQVTATKSTLEYYQVLQKFYAQLHDGHTNVYFPKELSTQVNSRPPIRTELIEGRVFITDVRNDSLRQVGVVPDLEVIKIDDMPVINYADTYVKPYQSSSTAQDMAVREFTYSLLAGDAVKPVKLELRDKNGRATSQVIPRSGYPKQKPGTAMTYSEIGNVGYLVINNFEDNKIVAQFDSLYNKIAETSGLIIDIRNNGGGDSGIGDQILSRLTAKSLDLFSYSFAIHDPRFPGEPILTHPLIARQRPNKKYNYNKPVVLLVNAATFSAAEDFTVAFDAMKLGEIIGQPTGGSTGQPIGFSLPGGGSARVCSKIETYPNGKEFVGIGIQPTIIINKTVKDFYNNNDAVLNRALALLK